MKVQTKRQQEASRLWQQSGTLYRLRQNLLATAQDSSNRLTGDDRLKLLAAEAVVTKAIEFNRSQFKTIKQRISNEQTSHSN